MSRGPPPALRRGLLRLRARQRGSLLRPDAPGPGRHRASIGSRPALPAPRTFLDVGCATGLLVAVARGPTGGMSGASTCAANRPSTGGANAGCDIHAGHARGGALPRRLVRRGALLAPHRAPGRPPRVSARGAARAARRRPGGDHHAERRTGCRRASSARGGGRRSSTTSCSSAGATLRRMLAEEGFAVEREVTWGGLAAGTAPAWLKRPADRLAKRWGFGDVMLYPGAETVSRAFRHPWLGAARRQRAHV